MTLTKAKDQEAWASLVKGEYEIDPSAKEDAQKKILLEKFQSQYEGFDFSGAEFSGNLKSDPKTLLENMRRGE